MKLHELALFVAVAVVSASLASADEKKPNSVTYKLIA
jgi:hypothetical protein